MTGTACCVVPGFAADNCVVKGTFDAVGHCPDEWMALTDRLGLRLLRAADAVPLREVTEDGWVEDLATRSGDRTLSPWAIVLRDGGAIAGFCGFFVRPVKGTTMGYGIVPEYRGRGLATEAAAAVLDWAERHGVDVYASIRPPKPGFGARAREDRDAPGRLLSRRGRAAGYLPALTGNHNL